MIKIKGEIVRIAQMFNDDLTTNCYEVVIDFKERPNLKLGDVVVEQNE